MAQRPAAYASTAMWVPERRKDELLPLTPPSAPGTDGFAGGLRAKLAVRPVRIGAASCCRHEHEPTESLICVIPVACGRTMLKRPSLAVWHVDCGRVTGLGRVQGGSFTGA